jgi:murein DD-endopeptidase MepM/ murein hydrolase activator NlpD
MSVAFSVVILDAYQKKSSELTGDFVASEKNLPQLSQDSVLLVSQDPEKKTLNVSQNDTINTMLSALGVDGEQIKKIIRSIRTQYGDFTFKDGQVVEVTVKKENQDQCRVVDMCFRPKPELELKLTHHDNGKVSIEKSNIPLKKIVQRIDGKIDGNFYKTAKRLGAPTKVVKSATNALSYIINFQHGIKDGDPFEMLYEVYVDDKGVIAKPGSVKYIAMVSQGKLHRLYAHSSNGGKSVNFYNSKGESIERGFLMTPLDSRRVRITSRFTKSRMHPIKGYCRAHKGVDFGAPHGTPVLAAADGVVVQAGYDGDYGNKVTIEHVGGYKTVYAHLSKMNVKRGSKVQQKQIVGAVGTTGLSTGPHLHHEVIYKNQHINPQGIKQFPTQKLDGKALQEFQYVMRDIEKQIVGIAPNVQLAAAEITQGKA